MQVRAGRSSDTRRDARQMWRRTSASSGRNQSSTSGPEGTPPRPRVRISSLMSAETIASCSVDVPSSVAIASGGAGVLSIKVARYAPCDRPQFRATADNRAATPGRRRIVSLTGLSVASSPFPVASGSSPGVPTTAANASRVTSDTVRPRARACALSAGPRPRRSTIRRSRGAKAMAQLKTWLVRIARAWSGSYRAVLGRPVVHCRTSS